MSSLTRERQLKRENGIKYWIDIRDFKKKTSWRCGKEIYSRTFKISESVFSISLFPNGSRREKKGHVSVILQNKSSWKAKCAVTFTVKPRVGSILRRASLSLLASSPLGVCSMLHENNCLDCQLLC